MDKINTEKEQQRVCINCECVLEDGEGTAYGIGEICDRCLETEFHHCDNCGRLIYEEDAYYVSNGDVLCSSCAEEYTTICDHCEERVYTSDTVSDGDITLCDDCFDERYHRCESCDRIISDDETCWHNNFPYCDRCYDDIDSGEIEDYNYKPDPIFYGEGKLFMGVELEIDEGGKSGENALAIKDIVNYRKEHIYIKSDGSLDEGLEIVSHPMTLDYHINEMDWESVMHKARNLEPMKKKSVKSRSTVVK